MYLTKDENVYFIMFNIKLVNLGEIKKKIIRTKKLRIKFVIIKFCIPNMFVLKQELKTGLNILVVEQKEYCIHFYNFIRTHIGVVAFKQ